jgi:hypothetical protein
VLFLVAALSVQSQEWNSARLVILYGGNAVFNFNSLEKIKNGIEINNATQIGISLADSNQPGHDLQGFDLQFRSFNGATEIRGEAYALTLDRVRVKAENSLNLGAGISSGFVDLDVGWQTLFSYTNIAFTDLSWDMHQLYLSYDCGIPVSSGGNGSLLGEPGDYYTIEIEVELVPTGPGF